MAEHLTAISHSFFGFFSHLQRSDPHEHELVCRYSEPQRFLQVPTLPFRQEIRFA